MVQFWKKVCVLQKIYKITDKIHFFLWIVKHEIIILCLRLHDNNFINFSLPSCMTFAHQFPLSPFPRFVPFRN